MRYTFITASLLILGHVLGIQALVNIGLVIVWATGFLLIVAINIPLSSIKNKVIPMYQRLLHTLGLAIPLVIVEEYLLAVAITLLYTNVYIRWSKC